MPQTLNVVLQIWGGTFYLLNKVFFSRAERSKSQKMEQTWRIRSWSVYLIGLPAWVIILIAQGNWIVAGVESGGMPAMLLGLILALRGYEKDRPAWLKRLDYFSVTIAIIAGGSYSFYQLGGLTTLNQVLELGIVAGFLVGTYTLAKKRPSGYLWFMLMNGSNAILQGREAAYFLMVQQVVSLGFVIDAYLMQRRKKYHLNTSML